MFFAMRVYNVPGYSFYMGIFIEKNSDQNFFASFYVKWRSDHFSGD